MGSTGCVNYFAGNPLNRLSYLRQSPAFLTSCLQSPKAKFIVYKKLAPLLQSTEDGKLKLKYVGWDDVKSSLGDDAVAVLRGVAGEEAYLKHAPEGLSKDEKVDFFKKQHSLIFLGVDERGAPESAKSLPISKPTAESSLESHSPYGVPHWALEVSDLPELADSVQKLDNKLEFTDLRLSMATLDGLEASIAGEGRALLDWNIRSVYCQACARPMRSAWGGWKRMCVPAEGFDDGQPCPSKARGVQNYSYPRTDPVVIMGITRPDRDSILLGRQKPCPKGVYSCLAGFLEYGESIEESVRREVYEESGVVVGDVYYHSSQPWPFPSSLMIGAIGVAKEGQTIRLDLDNELEDARFFTREEVLKVLDGPQQSLTKEDLQRFDQAAEHKPHDESESKPSFRMPSRTAIAAILVEAWARNNYLGSSKL